jgi:large subunit ribosomal protein L31
MKEGIHPNYVVATVTCACGNKMQTRSTRQEIKLDICSNCHPFFTGQQKLMDTAGRVERFEKRFAKTAGETVKKAASSAKAAKGQKLVTSAKKMAKVLSSMPIKAKTAPKSEKAAAPKAAPKDTKEKTAH